MKKEPSGTSSTSGYVQIIHQTRPMFLFNKPGQIESTNKLSKSSLDGDTLDED